MVLLKDLINKIKLEKFKFIKETTFINKIKETINNFFPNLNKDDIEVLEVLTIFTIDHISFKYGFDSENSDYYLQWEQNNCGDIKGVILLLLPFIDDKNNSYLLKKIIDLNHLLYSKSESYIPNNILELNRDNILETHFKYGNMGIGLLPFKSSIKSDILLDLYPQNEKKIYQVITDNFYGLLQTLDIINGKSYINWINIQPLNLNTYYTSQIYKKTTKLLLDDKNNDNKLLSNIYINYSGLWLGDIYNIFRIKYYEDGKKVKWLFFPYENINNNCKYLINILHEMINLEDIINSNYNNYNDLDETDKLTFNKSINDIINNRLNDSYYSNVIKYTLIWLINNYTKKDNIKGDDFKKFNISNPDEETQDDFNKKDFQKIDDINIKEIYNCLKYISENYIDHLWNFLRESIKLLIASVYGKFLIILIINNKFKINNNYYYSPFNETINNLIKNKYLNLKTIYNISKSLSHNDEWKILDKNYISLNTENRETFFKKIYDYENSNKWFNYSKNYKRQKLYTPDLIDSDIKSEIIEYEKNLLKEFYNSFIIIVFEELVTSGILNQFVLNLDITDKNRLPQNTDIFKKKRSELIGKMFDNNKNNWNECYYYLTNDKFKYIPKMRKAKKQVINQNDKYDEKTYFDIIAYEQEWTTFYAMNWISQISFFQHYIFHQIMYVTGATGQGKSTQVPKLLLYACKMYDYNSKANVICTQPRITPTIDNATRIAEELGLPIEQVSNTSSTKIKTENFYIQYKYEADSHTKLCSNDLTLKIVTDGTLKETLTKSPTLKIQKITDVIEFTNNNIYDIIIVDEAHEHNINMDIIIALSKQTCYFNNQVKLIIVSATMDDDEPIYRSFFKNINDNLLYPIKSFINNPFFTEKILLKPVHMDRRYHISPPGETTQYKVSEIYLDYDVNDINNNNKNIAKKIQELSYNKIIEICNNTTFGEILFFCNGKTEILEAIEYLNTNMPQGNIALPFFSELNQTYKDIITKINSKIYNIKNRRERIHLEWGNKYIEDSSVQSGLYKRAIIIATNVAEASVTIPGLTYVIDNGYAKENIYTRKLNISKLIVAKISESSRVQRRGRVGRVGDGTVYYMYKKDARKDVKPKYKITQENITESILSLNYTLNLKDYLKNPIEYKYSKLIVSDLVNPNMKMIQNGLYKDKITNKFISLISTEDKQLLEKSFTYTKLLNLYELNYKINQEYLGDAYYLKEGDNNKLISINTSLYVYDDGQLFENLLDGYGKFYLIHPYEDLIKRNIFNEIINVNNKKTNNIPLNEYQFFLRSIIDKNLIVDLNADSLFLYNDDILKTNRNFVKTEIAIKALQLKKDFEFNNLELAITIISASAMDCLKEVLEIKIFLDLLSNINTYSLGNLVNENQKWEQFKKIHTCPENNSDILFIYNIIKKFKNRFNKLLIFNIDNNNNINDSLNKYIKKEIKKFKILKNKNKEPPNNYDGELWNKLLNLKNNGQLNSNSEDDENDDEIQTPKKIYIKRISTVDFIFNDIENYRKEIENWAESNYFNPNIIISFIKKLGLFYLSKIDKYQKNKVIEWSKKFNSTFNKCLTDYNIEEKILRSFIYGYSNQFTFNDSNHIKSILNSSLYDVRYALSYKSNKRPIETFVIMSDFLFFLSFKEDDNNSTDRNIIEISILNKIKPEWLIPALPLVHNPLLNNIKQDIKNEKIVIDFFDSYTINKLNKEFTNNWSNHYFIWNTPDAPILQHFYKSIIHVINKMIR